MKKIFLIKNLPGIEGSHNEGDIINASDAEATAFVSAGTARYLNTKEEAKEEAKREALKEAGLDTEYVSEEDLVELSKGSDAIETATYKNSKIETR